MKARLVGAALSASLLLAGSGETPPQHHVKPAFDKMAPLTGEEKTTITETFERVKKYWLDRGLGVTAVHLTLLEATNATVCPGQKKTVVVRASDGNAGEFCFETDDIILSQTGINAYRYLANHDHEPESVYIDIAIAHEFGHAVEHAYGLVSETEPEKLKLEELEADCLAGSVLSELDPYAVSASPLFFAQAGDPIHGSTGERLSSFLDGAQTGIC